MMRVSKFWIKVFFCIYIAAICILCFIKPDGVPDVQLALLGIPADKIVHFCMFAPFTVLAFQAFSTARIRESKKMNIALLTILLVLGAGVAYATERIQGLTGYRSYEIADFYADLIGLSGGAAVVLIHRFIKGK